jgi:hypothetical protein
VGCVDVTILQRAAVLFKGGRQVSLSGNFAPFSQDDEYAVKNAAGAVVGNVVGDGMDITLSAAVATVRICFLPSPNIPFKIDQYPVVDFAAVVDSSLVPLKVEATYEDNQICAIITDIPPGTKNYIPILRKDKYEDVQPSLYDTTSLVLIYILGCLFCITACFALYKMIIVLYGKIKSGRRFRIAQLMIVFVFLFNGVRGVYFFLLPPGLNLKFIVSDYILVVLPTFFLFHCIHNHCVPMGSSVPAANVEIKHLI